VPSAVGTRWESARALTTGGGNWALSECVIEGAGLR
jgi:hypothetical protein